MKTLDMHLSPLSDALDTMMECNEVKRDDHFQVVLIDGTGTTNLACRDTVRLLGSLEAPEREAIDIISECLLHAGFSVAGRIETT